ncbi:MAG: radical SAM protein [Bacteroidales bacterium]|nr:radical SAM protein [Bacteroidales bacterium]
MKLSCYNIFVEKNGNIVGLNTMKNNYVLLSKNKYQELLNHSEDLFEFASQNEKIYDTLIDHGFIIPNDRNELNELRLCNKEVSFNRHYDLTIIPSLDCNLKCWYCWETHIPNSQMSNEVMDRIRKHVSLELAHNNIDSLSLEWFGGEPLLYFNEVTYPLVSSIKNLLDANKKSFKTSFITNGVLIDKPMLEKFKELNPKFQITLDGYKEKHNKVRVSKSGGEGTYNRIVDNLYLITEMLNDTHIRIRINYDDNTLKNIEELVLDLNDLDRSKVSIHLERVWQTSKGNKPDNKLLHDTIMLLTANEFSVDYGNFIPRYNSCKTDRYRQAGINYDGRVFKCTGRPFIPENSDGELAETGEIIWNRDRLANRIGRSTFELDMCLSCKMLPMCVGPCSQKCLERDWKNMENQCTLKTLEMSIEDFVVFSFNNLYSTDKLKAEYCNSN